MQAAEMGGVRGITPIGLWGTDLKNMLSSPFLKQGLQNGWCRIY